MSRGRESRTAGTGQRPLRVGEALRHALAVILRENSIHSLELAQHNITITEVRMSPDLRHANIFVVPLAGANSIGMLADLKKATPRLRKAIAGEMQLRFAPELHFMLDTTFDYAAGIARVLNSPDVVRDLGAETATDMAEAPEDS